ncbi:hypothetical protein NM688_g4788 [Phlebia brevispora]|uniref:Uncharacterized protein n=1 Tax=Phlebia brevispora TaxID=194682 RepID=A0ACC1T1N4_9APHY|nr:hypothetical protein NM688_g4788 [Phlebia brevispora]
MFSCYSRCGRTFKSAAALKLHRNRCSIAQGSFEESLKRKLAHEQELHALKVQERVDDDERRLEAERSVLRESEAEQSFVTSKIPQELPTGRMPRVRRRPRVFDDFVPHSLSTLPATLRPSKPISAAPLSGEELQVPDAFPASTMASTEQAVSDSCHYTYSKPDETGLYRCYRNVPSRDPEASVSLDELCEGPTFAVSRAQAAPWWSVFGRTRQSLKSAVENVFAPFLNATTFQLMSWFYSGSSVKSLGELDRLVHDVLLADDFNVTHLHGFSAARESQRLDDWVDEDDDVRGHNAAPFSAGDGWHSSSVKIRVPCEGVKHRTEDDAPEFEVPGVYFRRFVDVIRSTFQSAAALNFHLVPFRLFATPPTMRQPDAPGLHFDTPPLRTAPDASLEPKEIEFPHGEAERVYTELYNSEEANREYERIQEAQAKANVTQPQLETVIAFIMLWSDSTHLAQFGNASLWPLYAYFGGQSKYVRCKPSEFAAHHMAYIPSLPDTCHDWYQQTFGKAASAATLTHCKRELMHAIWALLLDNEFMKAYEEGIVVVFADGIPRRVFPRFFTYSADYPDKILLATLRFLGNMPYTRRRAKVRKSQEPVRQAEVEAARKRIFQRGNSMINNTIEANLRPFSWVPTCNAFTHLERLGLDFNRMLVVDQLHEFELGVWKATFTHLVRILHAAGNLRVQEMNQRIVMDLLWHLAEWHAYAKLRMHTDTTLQLFQECTRALGVSLRQFKTDVCPYFDTKELPKEVVVRRRAKVARATKRSSASEATSSKGKAREVYIPNSSEDAVPPATSAPEAPIPQCKEFNLSTYKLHALGNYPATVRSFGTTDNYSTQTGELEHRRVKRFYGRTNRNTFVCQIAKQQRREELIRHIIKREEAQRMRAARLTAPPAQAPTPTAAGPQGSQSIPQTQATPSTSSTAAAARSTVPFHAREPLPCTAPDVHHHMSNLKRFSYDLATWLHCNKDDRAVEGFLPRLRDHILARLMGRQFDGADPSFTDAERRSLVFRDNRIYAHKVLRVNYTTYDLRRAQDSLNHRTHADVMVLGHDDDPADSNPYWYARVIGVFHAEVRRAEAVNEPFKKVEFLWVRWFGRDSTWQRARRLPRIGFIPDDDPDAFGFLDPREVIRAVHLIPAFAHGKTDALLGPSIARIARDGNEDWQYFYVNIFVDRDMFMRFRGGGIGHRALGILLRLRQGTGNSSSDSIADAQENTAEVLDEDLEHPVSDHGDVSNNDDHEKGETYHIEDNGAEEVTYEDKYDELEEGEHDFEYSDSDEDVERPGAEMEPEDDDALDDELGAEDGEEDESPDDDLLNAEGFAPY